MNRPLTDQPMTLGELAVDTAQDARKFLLAMREAATGEDQDVAIPIVLMSLAHILTTGTRLGAMADVMVNEVFEPDHGAELDVEPIRLGLHKLFQGIDDYVHVVDPLISPAVVGGSISYDLASVMTDLAHGLRHFEAGYVDEALWFWQYSYLSSWGDRAMAALRTLHSVVSHVRLDDEDAEPLEVDLSEQASSGASTAAPVAGL